MSQLSQDASLDTTYTGIATTTRSWNNDRTVLSPAMAGLISLVAGIVVPGIGSMLGTALGMTGTLAGTLGAALGSEMLGSALATGISAFSSSFVSNAIIAGINGDFDLSRILTSAAVSGLTAGLTSGAMSFVNTTLIPQVSSVPGMEWLQNAITSQGPPNIQQILTSGLVRTLVSAPISAGVNSLLTGADFGQGLLAGLQSGFASNVLQPGLMNIVGDFGVANNLAPGSIEMSLLHAGVGALGGLILGGGRGALGGALGAGLSELIVPNLNVSTDTQRTLSQLIGGIGSLVVGDGSMAGATSALNGFEYNYLNHFQRTAANARLADLLQQQQTCTSQIGSGGCSGAELAQIETDLAAAKANARALSDANNRNLIAACAQNPGGSVCTAGRAELRSATDEGAGMQARVLGTSLVNQPDALLLDVLDRAARGLIAPSDIQSSYLDALRRDQGQTAAVGVAIIGAAAAAAGIVIGPEVYGYCLANPYSCTVAVNALGDATLCVSTGVCGALPTGVISREIAALEKQAAIPQIRINAAAGREFEEAALAAQGAEKYAGQPVTVTLSDGRLVTVIPDAVTATCIMECKNVINLSLTRQLEGEIKLAKDSDRTFTLIISPRTETMSEPLVKAIRENSGQLLRYDPVTRTTQQIDITQFRGGAVPR